MNFKKEINEANRLLGEEYKMDVDNGDIATEYAKAILDKAISALMEPDALEAAIKQFDDSLDNDQVNIIMDTMMREVIPEIEKTFKRIR